MWVRSPFLCGKFSTCCAKNCFWVGIAEVNHRTWLRKEQDG